MSTDYTAAWSTLNAVASILGATVEPSEHECEHLRTLRLSPFLWCHVSARGQHWNSPAGTLHFYSPHGCGAGISANVSIKRAASSIAADIRRRVLDPLREPLRLWLLSKVQKENEETSRKQLLAELSEALGEPLNLCHHRRKYCTPSGSFEIAEYDLRGETYNGRARWRAEITADNLAAFKMILRILGECQKLKPQTIEA
jgi:hypothetical protein